MVSFLSWNVTTTTTTINVYSRLVPIFLGTIRSLGSESADGGGGNGWIHVVRHNPLLVSLLL